MVFQCRALVMMGAAAAMCDGVLVGATGNGDAGVLISNGCTPMGFPGLACLSGEAGARRGAWQACCAGKKRCMCADCFGGFVGCLTAGPATAQAAPRAQLVCHEWSTRVLLACRPASSVLWVSGFCHGRCSFVIGVRCMDSCDVGSHHLIDQPADCQPGCHWRRSKL